jgi:quercetin dioxygenase-like cupin family protein
MLNTIAHVHYTPAIKVTGGTTVYLTGAAHHHPHRPEEFDRMPVWPGSPAAGKAAHPRNVGKGEEVTDDADLRREGYQVMNTSLTPSQLNPDHTHDFDARIMVLAGAITITRNGQARMYRPGDYWLTPAHAVHAELAGPEGVAIIIGRRFPVPAS